MKSLPISAILEPPQQTAAAPRPFQFRLWHLLLVMALLSVVLAITVPMVRAMRLARQRMESESNLRMIALGLQSYHDVWERFPPASTFDGTGRPAHSWRVLGHVHMMQSSFSRSYNFAELWNGPNNSKLSVGGKGNLFHNRYDGTTPASMTNYVAVVGPGTIWPCNESLSFNDFADDTGRTAMIVEISHSNIHWMEPRDLPVEELHAWLDPQHGSRAGGQVERGLVIHADWSEEYLPRDVAKERLRALLTGAGDEAVRRPDEDS
jgi:type II secretory pathway pseudopilin PulG